MSKTEVTYRISKLIPEKYLHPDQLKALEYRYTGSTTGKLLQVIGKALQNPEERIELSPDGYCSGRKYKVEMLIALIDKLQLKYLKLDYKAGPRAIYLSYHPYKIINKEGQEV